MTVRWLKGAALSAAFAVIAGGAPWSGGEAAELGVQQVPELMAVAGVAIAGPLPGEFQVITTFSAALNAKPPQAEAAKAFIKFLGGTAAQSAFKAKGLDPA